MKKTVRLTGFIIVKTNSISINSFLHCKEFYKFAAYNKMKRCTIVYALTSHTLSQVNNQYMVEKRQMQEKSKLIF